MSSVHEQYPRTVSMNGSSNSVQHSTLLTTRQAYRTCSYVHVVRAVGFVTRVALPLVRPLMCVPKPVLRTSNALSRAQVWSVGRDKNSLSQHHPWKPYRDIKSLVAIEMTSLGKTLSRYKDDPCCDLST